MVMMITDPQFYLVAVPAVFLYGMSKGGLGGIPGAVAVPMMALIIDPIQAAAILLPILCVMDLFAVWSFRKNYDRYHLRIMVPAGIVGIVIASVFIGKLSANAIQVMIGIIAVAFCLLYWIKGHSGQGRKPGKISGLFWSCIAGITSTQIHAGGPPLNIYLLPQNLDKLTLMGTMAVLFAIFNYLKLIPYTLFGQFDSSNLLTSLVLMPLAPLGVRAGFHVLHRIEQRLLYRLLYAFLFFSGCKLLYDGVS